MGTEAIIAKRTRKGFKMASIYPFKSLYPTNFIDLDYLEKWTRRG